MNARKTIIACLLVVCLLLPLAGCAEQKTTVHPPGFDKYTSLLGWHKEPILDTLELKEEDLTYEGPWQYALADTVEYCGLPFKTCLETESAYRLFSGFLYRITFPQIDEATAEQILAVAKHLTTELGIPYSDIQMPPDTDFISEKTPAELVKLLSEGGYTVDYWVLGTIDTPEANALSAWTAGFLAGKSQKYYGTCPPALRLMLEIGHALDGSAQVTLYYSLDYNNTWEQVSP